jgi:hypothetical protein
VYLPAMMAFIGLPMLALNCLAILNADSERTLLFGTITITPAAMSLLIWVCIPLLLATSAGQGLGKLDFWGKDVMPSFFSIRPMTTTRFIVVKLMVAAICVIACWVIVWLLIAVWAVLEASPLNSRASLVRAAFADLSLRNIAWTIAVMFGLVAITWRATVAGMWPSLAGRKAVSMFTAIASWAVLTIAVVVGSWIYRHPEVQPRLLPALPWLLGSLVVLKLCCAATVMAMIARLRLARRQSLSLISMGSFAIWAGLVTAASYITPMHWELAAGVALLLPVVRIAVAPLALHMNRHR